MTAPTEDIHSCSMYCTRPACVLAQRDEMRAELARLREQDPVDMSMILGAVARGWCHKGNARKEIDVVLAKAIAEEIAELYAAAPPAQPAINAEDRCKRTLIELDARLRECSIVGASAADAYDTFYQDMVAEALAAQPMYAGDIHRSMAAEIRLLREQLAQQEPDKSALSKMQQGRLVLEASTGMHGDVAKEVSIALCAALSAKDSAQSALLDDVGSLEYRGNSVSFIHQKMTAYRKGIDDAWAALRAAGIQSDGRTTVADGIARLAAQPAPAQEPAQRLSDAQDAARYRLLRVGRYWSVINGIGDELRAWALDSAIDSIIEKTRS